MITDYELIQQFQMGDKSAFDTLVKRHFNTTYGMLVRMVQEPMDAEDICQEVYIKVYKNLEKFRFESEFSTWIYRISINAANNYFRKRKLRETMFFFPKDYKFERRGFRGPRSLFTLVSCTFTFAFAFAFTFSVCTL